jgi:hypothetical protein
LEKLARAASGKEASPSIEAFKKKFENVVTQLRGGM